MAGLYVSLSLFHVPPYCDLACGCCLGVGLGVLCVFVSGFVVVGLVFVVCFGLTNSQLHCCSLQSWHCLCTANAFGNIGNLVPGAFSCDLP